MRKVLPQRGSKWSRVSTFWICCVGPELHCLPPVLLPAKYPCRPPSPAREDHVVSEGEQEGLS